MACFLQNEAGLSINNNLVVKEGQTVSFWMQPSFPITTRPCFDVPNVKCFYKTYSFSIHASESVVKLSDCNLVVTQSIPRSGEVKMSPIPTIGSRPKPFIWQLNFNVYNDAIMNANNLEPLRTQLTPIFKNYQIQSINVCINDSPTGWSNRWSALYVIERLWVRACWVDPFV